MDKLVPYIEKALGYPDSVTRDQVFCIWGTPEKRKGGGGGLDCLTLNKIKPFCNH